MTKAPIFVLCVLLAMLMFCRSASAASSVDIWAKYSSNIPTIDGFLGSAEWNDTRKYEINLTGVIDIPTWLYVKHNGTHIHFGLLVWSIALHATDEFAILFDEGDDGGSGSGTRDLALTPLQEDRKACYGSGILRDGFYNVSQWYAKDVEIDFAADCAHETDHSTLASEIENSEGLAWVDDHWECEFTIPLVGNDEGVSDVSDLSCNVMDIIGIKIQYFHTGARNYYYPAGDIYQVLTYASLGFTPPTVDSCNLVGEKKDTFNLYENVYANGTGFLPSASYDFYIVEDVETWTDGQTIPARMPDTASSITSDTDGNVIPVIVWSDPSTVGLYDIIVDVNANGLYDEGIDTLDDNDTMLTAGFAVPEFSSIVVLLLLFSSATLTAVFVKRKHIT